jgi:hypothetical protein
LARTDTDRLVEFYVNEFELPTIKKDEQRKVSWEQGSTTSGEWDTFISLTIRYPIIVEEGTEEVLKREASQRIPSMGEIRLEGGYLGIEIQARRSSPPDLVETTIINLERTIEWKNDDVSRGNQELRTEIKNFVEARKGRIAADTAFIASLIETVPIPIEKRENRDVLGIDFHVNKRIRISPPPNTALQEPVFPHSQFLDIVNTIRNTGTLFERTPRAYSKLFEEDLRDILLLGLNMMYMFEGGFATAETFNKTGHTDIYLHVPLGKVLVAECKIWNGPEYYSEAIGQLLGYLTWRENYGILITFSKNRDFEGVMVKAKEAATSHLRFMPTSLREVSRGHFVTEHYLLPDSKERKVELHHLLFYLEPE